MPPDTQRELLPDLVSQGRGLSGIGAIKSAVEGQQRCTARFVKSVLIWELLKGEIVEERMVHLFELYGCEATTMAYAWKSGPDVVVVAHGGAALGPAEAVQAVFIGAGPEPAGAPLLAAQDLGMARPVPTALVVATEKALLAVVAAVRQAAGTAAILSNGDILTGGAQPQSHQRDRLGPPADRSAAKPGATMVRRLSAGGRLTTLARIWPTGASRPPHLFVVFWLL